MIEPVCKEAIALARPIHAAIVRKYVLQHVNADEKRALLKFAEQLQAESEKQRDKPSEFQRLQMYRFTRNVRFWHRAAVAALTNLDFNRFRNL
jgi:uncharacterized Fe-S cluster-containing radical SAM superfamily enzyme